MASQSQTDEINGLKLDLEESKRRRRQLDRSDPLYAQHDISITNEITETRKSLNLLLEQQDSTAGESSPLINGQPLINGPVEPQRDWSAYFKTSEGMCRAISAAVATIGGIIGLICLIYYIIKSEQ